MEKLNILHVGGYDGSEGERYLAMGADFTFVEPIPEYAQKIRKRGYAVIEKAVWESKGVFKLYLKSYASSLLVGKGNTGKSIDVECVPLSDIQGGFNMLVIDAQGATMQILESGDVSKFSYIICEASQRPRYTGEKSMGAIVEYLSGQGFRLLYPFKHVGHDIFDLVFVRND